MPTHGLTLGKFAPLHRGHQLVIATALAETDAVTVVIYDAPEVTPIPLSVRARWLRTLYPSVRVLEAWDGPTEVGDTPAIRQRHETYLLDTLKLRDDGITHFYSSEFYGDHVSRAFGAVNRQVDPDRRYLPISATQIRADPYTHRAFVDPLVYRDLIGRVALLGAPSTGKTTLAAALAAHYHTVWMPEYGREYWETQHIDRRLTPEQLVEIAEVHLEREDAHLLAANRWLFSDTNALTTYMFAQAYHGGALPRLHALAQQAAARYDVMFLCGADIPYADTWDRSGDVDRQRFQKQITADLRERHLPFIPLYGSVDERIAQVSAVLSRVQRFTSLGELVSH